jgi:site-specific DNA-methyltransferase (adenine-specific)
MKTETAATRSQIVLTRMIHLVKGNAFKLIKAVPDSSIGLVMTDVPYPDMKIHDGTRNIISSEQWISWFTPMAEQIKRVLLPSGSFVTTFNSKVDRGVFFDWVHWMRHTLGMHYVMPFYWVKKNIIPGSVKNMRFPRDSTDFIAWFSKSPDYWSSLTDIDWKRYNPATAVPTNLIYATSNDSPECREAMRQLKMRHTGKYPSAIPDLFIKMTTQLAHTVLDPFSGTGTTLLSAYENNRNAIGFEKNLRNVTLTRRICKLKDIPITVRTTLQMRCH